MKSPVDRINEQTEDVICANLYILLNYVCSPFVENIFFMDAYWFSSMLFCLSVRTETVSTNCQKQFAPTSTSEWMR